MTRAREAVEEPKPAGRMGVELVCCRIIMGEPLLMKMEMRVLRSIILRSVVIMMVAVEDESSSAAERPKSEKDKRRADEGLCPGREHFDLQLLPEEQPEAGEDKDTRSVTRPPAEADLDSCPRTLEREGEHRGEVVGSEDDMSGAGEEARKEDEHQLLQSTGKTRANYAEECVPMKRTEASAVAALGGVVTDQSEPALSVDRADSFGDGHPPLKGMSRDDK